MTKHIFIEHFMVKLYVCLKRSLCTINCCGSFEYFKVLIRSLCVLSSSSITTMQSMQCHSPSYFILFFLYVRMSYRITCVDKVQVTSTEIGENIQSSQIKL